MSEWRHMPDDEERARADKPGKTPLLAGTGWQAPLARVVKLRDGTAFATLFDVSQWILALREGLQERKPWQRAVGLLIAAAEGGSPFDIEGGNCPSRACAAA